MKFVYKICGLAVIMLLPILNSGCRKQQTVVSGYAYTQFATTCMGVEHDGSQTLRAWGKGSNRADAIEQAKKNAVYDVIFRGITGEGECQQRALVTEVNARTRYAAYFDPFFSDGGEYLHFVKEENSGEKSRIEASGTSQVNYGVVVTVNRPALRQQLVADGILRQ